MADFAHVPIERIDEALEILGDFIGTLRDELSALDIDSIEMQVGGALPVYPRPTPIPFTGGACHGVEFISDPFGGGCGVPPWRPTADQITAFIDSLFAGLDTIDWQQNE